MQFIIIIIISIIIIIIIIFIIIIIITIFRTTSLTDSFLPIMANQSQSCESSINEMHTYMHARTHGHAHTYITHAHANTSMNIRSTYGETYALRCWISRKTIYLTVSLFHWGYVSDPILVCARRQICVAPCLDKQKEIAIRFQICFHSVHMRCYHLRL